MATTLTKDSLYPGTIRKPGREPLVISDADIDGAVTAANQLIKDGYTIPAYWEHQDDNGPVKLSAADKGAHVAKHTFGRVKEAFKDDGGVLQLKLEVDDEADAKRLPKVRFVSPELRKDWKDAEGRTWKGWTISHVAATPIPVQRQQKPFDPTNAIRLSMADYQLSDYEPGSGKTGEGSPTDGLDAEPSGAKGGQITKCLIGLAKKGIKLPDDTTEANLCERLNIVLDALPDEPENTMPEDNTDEMGEVGTGQPIALSLQKQEATAKALAKRGLRERINSLIQTGRILPALGQKLTARLDKVQLSFTEDGELTKTDLVIQIEAYEQLAKNTAWKPKGERLQLSNVTEIDAPDGTTEKTDKQILDAWDKTGDGE